MIVNNETLDLAFKGFKTLYSDAFAAVQDHASEIAMAVASASRDETCAWLGSMPNLREWIGPRVVNALKAHGFTIANRKFESTIAVKRDDFADDRLGVFKPMIQLMGQRAAQHRQDMVLGLLKNGFTTPGFDGQNFFDDDHPVEIDGTTVSVSNTGGGSGTAWYLLDTSKPVRPVILQTREDDEFTSLTRAEDAHVFINDEYLYGVRARAAAGFGLWQLAHGSKQTLNATNYAAARAAMMTMRADGGSMLGVMPTVLVVPPSLEDAALRIVNTEYATGGESNPWKDRRTAPMQS
jgi:phage major head subunit gpT-like protein